MKGLKVTSNQEEDVKAYEGDPPMSWLSCTFALFVTLGGVGVLIWAAAFS